VPAVKNAMNTPDSTFSDDFVYIYDMMGNMRTSSGAGSSVTFSYDENGRMLSQGYAPQRQALSYVYGAGSYAVSRPTGNTPLDENRNASRTNNFSYDASGRMVHDSSKGLSVTYGMDGLPVLFEQTDSSGAWREISVYDPSGWRVATYSYADCNLVSLRTNIMLDGRKELERRRAYAGNDSSVMEYAMLYGNGAMLGRRHGNGSYEWYVKDRQGSLVMSLVDENVGSALAYEPYGYLHLRRASGSVPAEQYTGKEYDGRLGLYYFGARFFDPTFAMWLTPDPARQYLNPYSYGGDPVNGLDPDGRWGLLSGFVPIFSIVSAIYSASTSSESVGEWFGTAAIDYFGNNICATVEPAATGISVVWGALSTVGAFGRAITGNGEWGDVLKPFAISIFSSLQSDWNSVNNSFAAVGRGDLGEFFTNMSSSGVNGLATDYNAFQYSANKGFGSQEYTYEFSVEGSGGHKNIIWGQKTNDPKNGGRNAENLGQNIVLYKPYYGKSDEEKKSILFHEFVHSRQQSKYGLGGMFVRKKIRIKSRPADDAVDCGMFGFSCEDTRAAFDSYGGGSKSLDYAEIEAESHQRAGVDSPYWFDAPVFY
jgi:RHS repeat-associated protein